MPADRRQILDHVLNVSLLVAAGMGGYYFFQNYMSPYLTSLLDPERANREQAMVKAKANLQRIRRPRTESEKEDSHLGTRCEDLVLNEYENMVALEVVAPEDIPVGFDNIGGLEQIIEELKESIIYPLTMPHLYVHGGALLSAPPGVLLYGPPGCGKTMLAKAVAHESGASFINLHISTLTEKWYGDSNKLVRAVFSLAHKLQPAIIFIDEIDAVLGTRRSGEHEASGMVKAEFMTLWDGLTTTNAAGQPARIVVLGATNRINDIDDAILRRMPKKFPVPLPDKEQRLRILQLVLADTKRDSDFNLDYLAKITQGMSGSDIKETCRDAAMVPMREFIRESRKSGVLLAAVDASKVRALRTEDFFRGLGSSARQQNQVAKSASDGFKDAEGDAAHLD